MGLDDDDIRELEIQVIINPNAGKVISGTGGLRKLRFELPNTGKSGGARVLYVDFLSYGKTFFINAYTKPEKDELTENEKKQYKRIIDETLKVLRRSQT